MKRRWLTAVLSICFGLLIATTWLLLTPTPVSAATGSADCGNGKHVYCNAADCDCTDGVGCTATNPFQPSVFTGCIGPKSGDDKPAPQSGTVAE